MTTINGTTDESQTQENGQQLFEVNGEQLTLEELQKGYMRQSDYTRKTQELKAQPREQEDDRSRVPIVQAELQPYIDSVVAARLAEKEFDSDLQLSPDLKKYETAIKKLSEQTGLSPYEVIDEYGFGKSEKLKKAKESRLLGDREYGTGDKSIKSMSDEELDELIKKNSHTQKYRVSGT